MKENDIIICGHGSDRPSLKQMGDYNSSRYNQIAPNGVHKGVVCVMRPKVFNQKGRNAFREKYTEILGRNHYSQDNRQYVYSPKTVGNEKIYYSDCSSSVMATYREIGYDYGLLNTAGIYYSPNFKKLKLWIRKGHIVNPRRLRVGDLILYAGSDPSRPLQIGHVEAVYRRKTRKEIKNK